MDSWKIRHKNIEKEKKCRGEIYSFIVDQIEGLIDIEIGNYLYNKTDALTTKLHFGIDDLLMIEHLHYEDILWFLMNFYKEKEKMKRRVDEYIEWKEKYNEKNKK